MKVQGFDQFETLAKKSLGQRTTLAGAVFILPDISAGHGVVDQVLKP